MPGFNFDLSQLVTVPGKDGLQGRVSIRTEYAAKPSFYHVTWLADGSGYLESDLFSEAELIEAQKKKPDSTMTVKIEADTAEAEKAIDGAALKVAALNKEAKAAVDTLSKLPRNVFGKSRARSKRRPRR